MPRATIIGGGSGATSTLPGYEIGYDQITSPVSVTATAEASGTTVISCAAHTFDGAAVMVEFYAPRVDVGAAAAHVIICLFEGATEIGQIALANGTSSGFPVTGRIRFTPTAASHTYTVTAFRVTNNGTIQAGAGGTSAIVPAFVRFTKA